jgi:hypothetical protein
MLQSEIFTVYALTVKKQRPKVFENKEQQIISILANNVSGE